MTCLLRCRSSTSEMARLFGAEAPFSFTWRESIWPGEAAPIILLKNDNRELRPMSWGLPANAFIRPVPAAQRSIAYPRDLMLTGSRLRNNLRITRCLIILEAFAYPAITDGVSTRTWFGLWDRPLVAWAGICTQDGCAGMLASTHADRSTCRETMPRLLRPEDCEAWLLGSGFLCLQPGYDAQEFYRENMSERWSTGEMLQRVA